MAILRFYECECTDKELCEELRDEAMAYSPSGDFCEVKNEKEEAELLAVFERHENASYWFCEGEIVDEEYNFDVGEAWDVDEYVNDERRERLGDSYDEYEEYDFRERVKSAIINACDARNVRIEQIVYVDCPSFYYYIEMTDKACAQYPPIINLWIKHNYRPGIVLRGEALEKAAELAEKIGHPLAAELKAELKATA